MRRRSDRRLGVWCRCAFVGAVVMTVGAMGAAALAAPSASSPAGAERYVIDPAASRASYRVGEVFLNDGNRFNVAVGTTHAIQGEIFVDRTDPRRSRVGTITVDISQLTSDEPRRDNRIRRQWLESERFPQAVFTPAQIQGLPEAYPPGGELAVKILGDLKIHNVTRPTTFDTTLRLAGAAISGVATTTIRMTDFGIDPPSILGFLKAQNEVKLEFQFVARHAQ
jgi:polyisoprenoid-binding protein YceI